MKSWDGNGGTWNALWMIVSILHGVERYGLTWCEICDLQVNSTAFARNAQQSKLSRLPNPLWFYATNSHAFSEIITVTIHGVNHEKNLSHMERLCRIHELGFRKRLPHIHQHAYSYPFVVHEEGFSILPVFKIPLAIIFVPLRECRRYKSLVSVIFRTT